MDILPDNAVVYFHNLGYDVKMFNSFNIINSIDKGKNVYSQKFKYNNKTIIFKDSLAIMSLPIKKI